MFPTRRVRREGLVITGHEYLLITVLLISVQVIAQFVPFA
jgi:hypothetical protein